MIRRHRQQTADRLAPARAIGTTFVLALALGGCNPATPTPSSSAAPTSTASLEPPVPSTSPGASASAVAADQTDTDWGRIWDRLPADFPIYPGATPAEQAETGPVSATFALQGPRAKTVATWMQSELERLAFTTEALNGPLEDGSFVLDATGSAGCRIEVAVAPLGGLITVTVRYGADCPSP